MRVGLADLHGRCVGACGTESGCNGADDDCDGTADEGFTVTCYMDLDHDGYAPSGGPDRDFACDETTYIVTFPRGSKKVCAPRKPARASTARRSSVRRG